MYIGYLRLVGQYQAIKVEFEDDPEDIEDTPFLNFDKETENGREIRILVNKEEIAYLEYWPKVENK